MAESTVIRTKDRDEGETTYEVFDECVNGKRYVRVQIQCDGLTLNRYLEYKDAVCLGKQILATADTILLKGE